MTIIEIWTEYNVVYVLHYLLMKEHDDFSFQYKFPARWQAIQNGA